MHNYIDFAFHLRCLISPFRCDSNEMKRAVNVRIAHIFIFIEPIQMRSGSIATAVRCSLYANFIIIDSATQAANGLLPRQFVMSYERAQVQWPNNKSTGNYCHSNAEKYSQKIGARSIAVHHEIPAERVAPSPPPRSTGRIR